MAKFKETCSSLGGRGRGEERTVSGLRCLTKVRLSRWYSPLPPMTPTRTMESN